jgi:hypothetical protein
MKERIYNVQLCAKPELVFADMRISGVYLPTYILLMAYSRVFRPQASDNARCDTLRQVR